MLIRKIIYVLIFTFLNFDSIKALNLEIKYETKNNFENIYLGDIGYIQFYKIANKKNAYWINEIYIYKKYRGNSIGTYLLKKTMNLLINMYAAEEIWLWPYAFDREAETNLKERFKRTRELIQWYKSFGFEEVEDSEHMVYYVKKHKKPFAITSKL